MDKGDQGERGERGARGFRGRDSAEREDPNGPTFRDLYEQSEKADLKIEKVNDRLSRMEKGFIVLAVLVASPKVGGPDAASLVKAAVSAFS